MELRNYRGISHTWTQTKHGRRDPTGHMAHVLCRAVLAKILSHRVLLAAVSGSLV